MRSEANIEAFNEILKIKVEGVKSFDPTIYKTSFENRKIKSSDNDVYNLSCIALMLLAIYDLYFNFKAIKKTEKEIKKLVFQMLADVKNDLNVIGQNYKNAADYLYFYIMVLLSLEGYIPKVKIMRFLRILITYIDYVLAKGIVG